MCDAILLAIFALKFLVPAFMGHRAPIDTTERAA